MISRENPRTGMLCFFANAMKSALASTVGFVLSITTLFLLLMARAAASKHFGMVFNVSLLTLSYPYKLFSTKVDFPDPGLPIKMIISCEDEVGLILLSLKRSPVFTRLLGSKKSFEIVSFLPRNN